MSSPGCTCTIIGYHVPGRAAAHPSAYTRVPKACPALPGVLMHAARLLCLLCRAGILAGAVLVGSHMAMIQGVAQAMLSSYIPSNGVKGLGRVSGTAWSFTDLLLGKWAGLWATGAARNVRGMGCALWA
jgi:hypothetical protein